MTTEPALPINCDFDMLHPALLQHNAEVTDQTLNHIQSKLCTTVTPDASETRLSVSLDPAQPNHPRSTIRKVDISLHAPALASRSLKSLG
jgi:hypothetical protein